MTKLKDHQGQIFTKKNDLDQICHKFCKELYQHKDISEEALTKVFEDIMVTFTDAMNSTFIEGIMQHELYEALDSMANGKVSCMMRFPLNSLNCFGPL